MLIAWPAHTQSSALQYVATNAALKAFNGAVLSGTVLREGFYTPGDGGAATYVHTRAACSISGGDNGSQVVASDGGCWVASFVSTRADARAWGAYFDGSSDDGDALQAAFNWAAHNSATLVLPCGTALFNHHLNIPSGLYYFSIVGADQDGQCSSLVYNGTNTTIDIITIGTVGDARKTVGVNITGFRLDSNTQMTAGAALHLWHLLESRVDPVISGQFGNGRFWNGVWYDEVDVLRVPNVRIFGAANDNVLINGSRSTEAWFANYVGEVLFGSGKIAPSNPQLDRGGNYKYSATGIHVAGSSGGMYTENVDIIANHNNVKVDNAVTGVQNQTVTLGPGTYTDSGIDNNILLDDSAPLRHQFGDTKRFFDYGWIACAACAGGTGHGIRIKNFTGGAVDLAGYAINGNHGCGVYVEDVTATVNIASSETFAKNDDGNICSSVAGPKIAINNPAFLDEQRPYDENTLSSVLPIYSGPYVFTPRLQLGGSETGMTYSSRSGFYFYNGLDVVSRLGSSTGVAAIAGLPRGENASLASGGGGTISYATGLSGLLGMPTLALDSGGDRVANLYQWTPTGISALSSVNFSSSSVLRGRMSYVRK
jgi:hypothetical protein